MPSSGALPPLIGTKDLSARPPGQSPDGTPTVSTVRLPTGRVARLLLGLCRRGPAHQPPEVAEGWAVFRWKGLDGDAGEVAVRTSEHPDHTEEDDLALGALGRAPTEDRSYDELAAVLSRLLELDGQDGQWRWQRVGELIYGRRSHPERHNPALRMWLALLERGLWHLEPPATTASAKKSRRGGKASAAAPRAKARSGRRLLALERLNRSSATVRLEPGFAAELAERSVSVPDEVFRLSQADHVNPEGNLPTRATRARVRLGAVLWSQRTGEGEAPQTREDEVRLRGLLQDYAGVDVEPVSRRRHLAQWSDRVLEDLRAVVTDLALGLARVPERARQVLETVVHIARPPGARPDRPVGPSAGSPTKTGLRAPPVPA